MTSLVDCPCCNGAGTVEAFHGLDDEMVLEDCHVCDGAGRIPSDVAARMEPDADRDIDERVAAYWERAA